MAFDFHPRIYTDQYYVTLGRFVSDFSEIEQAMQVALWYICGIKSPIAQAIFSGVRADDAANKISRIGVAQKWPDERKAEWKAISDRVSLLRSLRNDILHYGVNWERENEWVTSNRLFVHTEEKVTNTPVTIPILNAAIKDLHSLSIYLLSFAVQGKVVGPTALDRTLSDTWQYKPPPQGGRQSKSPGRSPKPKRRPPPFRK